MIKTLLLIGSGSFLGGICRYLISRAVQNIFHHGFPLGTMAVNIAGCFLIGIIYGMSEKHGIPGDNMKLFLTVGFCGGFTTFSTFVQESSLMLGNGNIVHFVLYPTISFGLGPLAAYLGNLLAR